MGTLFFFFLFLLFFLIKDTKYYCNKIKLQHINGRKIIQQNKKTIYSYLMTMIMMMMWRRQWSWEKEFNNPLFSKAICFLIYQMRNMKTNPPKLNGHSNFLPSCWLSRIGYTLLRILSYEQCKTYRDISTHLVKI